MTSKGARSQIPDQTRRAAIVTGAHSRVGLSTARELARRGAFVVLACRNTTKGEEALVSIASDVPGATLELSALDLSSLASVEQFALRFHAAHGDGGLDLLINNAGVMAP